MKFYLGTLTRYYTSVVPLDNADTEVVAGAVLAWRHWLNKELPYALDWDESPTAPFETVEVGEKDWESLGAGASSQLTQPQLWIPGPHDFLFEAHDLAERDIWVGSSAELQSELSEVANRPAAHGILGRLVRRSLDFRLPLALMPENPHSKGL